MNKDSLNFKFYKILQKVPAFVKSVSSEQDSNSRSFNLKTRSVPTELLAHAAQSQKNLIQAAPVCSFYLISNPLEY